MSEQFLNNLEALLQRLENVLIVALYNYMYKTYTCPV